VSNLRNTLVVYLGMLTILPAAADTRVPPDLYVGEALYQSFLGHDFDALVRLESGLGRNFWLDQNKLGVLRYEANRPDFTVGSFSLKYRLHERAAGAIKVAEDAGLDGVDRDFALHQLGQTLLRKDQRAQALAVVDRISGRLPVASKADITFQKALVLIINDRNKEAITLLEPLLDNDRYAGFASYNLGVAYARLGLDEKSIRYLEKVADTGSDTEASHSIRDKAALALGFRLLELNRPEQARASLVRVRLEGPFSNRALLGLGWADVALKRYDRAIVSWNELAGRVLADMGVQEALLGIGYAYGKLGLHGKAALMYEKAIKAFDSEMSRLETSRSNILAGTFFRHLIKERLKQAGTWAIRLDSVGNSPENHYLAKLMANHDAQEAFGNLLDLEELNERLQTWRRDVVYYQEMIRARKDYYDRFLPGIDKDFELLAARMSMQFASRHRIYGQLSSLNDQSDPGLFVSAVEQKDMDRIRLLHANAGSGTSASDYRRRLDRLSGLIRWQVLTDYDARRQLAQQGWNQLDSELESLKLRHHAVVSARQVLLDTYEGYDDQLNALASRISKAIPATALLISQQRQQLTDMAITEIDRRIKQLKAHQVKARFELARSYDRARGG